MPLDLALVVLGQVQHIERADPEHVAGTFGITHAPASGFDELVRITRPGGHLVLSVRARGMEEAGFPAAIARLEATKRWRHVETVGPFQAMRSEPESLYVVHVCRKTG